VFSVFKFFEVIDPWKYDESYKPSCKEYTHSTFCTVARVKDACVESPVSSCLIGNPMDLAQELADWSWSALDLTVSLSSQFAVCPLRQRALYLCDAWRTGLQADCRAWLVITQVWETYPLGVSIF
jgi:hypothetical protein